MSVLARIRQCLHKCTFWTDAACQKSRDGYALTSEWRRACRYAQQAKELSQSSPTLDLDAFSASDQKVLQKGYPVVQQLQLTQDTALALHVSIDPLEHAEQQIQQLQHQLQEKIQQHQPLFQEYQDLVKKYEELTASHEKIQAEVQEWKRQVRLLEEDWSSRLEDAQFLYRQLENKGRNRQLQFSSLEEEVRVLTYRQQYYQQVITFLSDQVLDEAQRYQLGQYVQNNPCEE